MTKPLIVIPARIGSTRLKNKPLREINGVPLITHVCLRALEAGIADHIILSTDDERVCRCAPKGVGFALDRKIPDEHCGSDRVAYVAERWDWKYDHIINLQGDLPFIAPGLIQAVYRMRLESEADIVTVGMWGEAVYPGPFERYDIQQHIGVYAFTRDSLKTFASLPQSMNEIEQRLEGCRMTDNRMSIAYLKVDHMPLEINTESDLAHANLIAEAIWRSEDIRPRYRGADSITHVPEAWGPLEARFQGRDYDPCSD